MSGIYGVFRRDGAPVSLTALESMRSSMAAWGPDSQESWVGGNFATGFALMRNTPESFYEHQPILESSKPRYVICADARLDNREELCRYFGIPAAESAVMPDSELIKLAYLKWGDNYPEHLVGAYAVAIWDCNKQELHLSRDHMGFRPLYIYENSQVVVFASDVEAVLRSGEVAKNLDFEAVCAARAQYTPLLRERSLVKDIKKVLPAHSLSISRYSTVKREYWSPDNCQKVRYRNDAEYAEAMREQLMQAVCSSTRSAYQIGSHLSGGLDSSAITIAASRCLQDDGRKLAGAYAWSPAPEASEYPLLDERARLQEVCDSEGIECTYSDLSTDDIIGVWLSDMSTSPQDTMYNELSVRRHAKSRGIRTLLSGWGGDEFATFNGRGFLCEKLRQLKLHELVSEMKQQHKVRGLSYKGMVYQQLLMPLIPDAIYAKRGNLVPAELRNDPKVSAAIKKHWLNTAIKSRHPSSKMQHHKNALDMGWLSYRIEGWAARSVDQALEYRYPLLDRRLIEFCIGLPAEQFMKNGWTRYVFRNAVSGMLPDRICWGLDNKQETAKQHATAPIIASAISEFSNKCEMGTAEFEGISCMWQDQALPDSMR